MAKRSIAVLWLAATVLLSGCSITKNVRPVAAGTLIQTIHVVKNDDTLYKQSLLDELVAILQEQGFEAKPVLSEKGNEGVHVLTYQANWAWDMAMYLTYFRAMLREGDKVLGEVEYDARRGGGNMGKFGPTADKVRPLMVELLKDVQRRGLTPAAGQSTAKQE